MDRRYNNNLPPKSTVPVEAQSVKLLSFLQTDTHTDRKAHGRFLPFVRSFVHSVNHSLICWLICCTHTANYYHQSINHLFESGDMAHTQELTHTHTIHNNTKEGK